MVVTWVRLTILMRSWRREDGQDLVEYALLCGFLSCFALALMILLGPYIKNVFQDLINAINSP